MRFEEKNSKNGLSLLFRVLNPNIEAQKKTKEKFLKSPLQYLFFKRDLETLTSNDGASKRHARPRRGTRTIIRENVRDGRQSEADEREGGENVGVILRVRRENGEEDDVDDEDSTNWNDVDGEPPFE